MMYRPWLMWLILGSMAALALLGLFLLVTGRVTLYDCGPDQKFCFH
jgi:hypothetical protein